MITRPLYMRGQVASFDASQDKLLIQSDRKIWEAGNLSFREKNFKELKVKSYRKPTQVGKVENTKVYG